MVVLCFASRKMKMAQPNSSTKRLQIYGYVNVYKETYTNKFNTNATIMLSLFVCSIFTVKSLESTFQLNAAKFTATIAFPLNAEEQNQS